MKVDRQKLIDILKAVKPGLASKELVGVNIWDENYKYINYRYCICKPEPFLSEFMRYLFYTKTCNGDKLVNDGGVLGNETLKKFKDKLNSLRVRKVHSWIGYRYEKETRKIFWTGFNEHQ